MLVDLKFHNWKDFKVIQDGNDFMLSYQGDDKILEPILLARKKEPGVYYSYGLRNWLKQVTDYKEKTDYPGWPWFHHGGLDPAKPCSDREKFEAILKSCPSNGCADNFEQIRRKCSDYWDSDRKFILTLGRVTKEQSPGWRWHKNGRYLGDFEPECEHLGDEPVIESIVTFDFSEIERNDG